MSYTQRVRDSILPLSEAQSLPAAFREWRFTGNTTDHEEPNETCQLCGQEGLRYHFEIENDQTLATLEVGSECILKFQVAVYEHGHELGPDDAKRLLNEHMRQMRLESCLRALHRLAAKEVNSILSSALKYYQTYNRLTPKFANVVMWRLQANGIDHDASFFKVRLDKASYVNDLRDMPARNVRRIWPALSSSQRKKAIELGHKPPTT